MRKVKTLVALAITFVLLVGTHVFAATVPNNTVVLGNKAYSVAYLVNASADEINAQLRTLTNNPQTQIIYRLGDMGTWKYLFTDETVSENALKAWGTVDYYPENGNVTKLSFVEQQQKIVAAISSVDATNVKVTFIGGAAVTEESLAGKAITLTADKAVVATYKAASLKDGVATFSLSGEDKLADAANYTAKADWTDLSDITFMAKVAPEYVKSFAKVSEVLAGKAGLNVNIKAVNQYGNDITIDDKNTAGVTVAATLNGMPLSGAEVTYTPGQSSFVIVKALAEKENLVVTFKDAKGNVIGQPISYTVIKADPSVVTAFVVKADKTEIASKETFNVTVNAIDQYNYPVDIVDGDIRWVVNGVIDAATGKTLTKTPTTPGTYKIEAYYIKNALKNGTVTVSVGAAKLTTLTVTGLNPAKTYNQENIVLAKIAGDEGAILTPDMIKYNVIANTKDTTANDIVITTALKGGEGNDKNDIIMTVKTLKAGVYTITPYVGAAIDDAKVVKGSVLNLTTTINPVITTIDDITFDAKELKTGVTISKNIVVRNEHGEVVPFDAKVVEFISVPATKFGFDEADGKTTLSISADKEGTYLANIMLNGKIYKTYTLIFAAPKLTKIEVGADVSGVVAGDPADFAQYRPINFFDQDGIAMPWTALKATVIDPKGNTLADSKNLVDFVNKKFENGKLVDDPASYALCVLPTDAIVEGTYTVKVATEDGKITDSLLVNVDKARVATTISVDTTAITLPIGASKVVTINVLDQYNKPFDKSAVVAESSNINLAIVGKPSDVTKGVCNAIITAKAQGTVDITYSIVVGETKISAKTTVTVKTAGALINSVVIDHKAEAEAMLFYSDKASLVLKATALDVDGKTVVADGFKWSIVSVVDKEGKAIEPSPVSIDQTGNLTSAKFAGTVVVKVETTNFKTDTVALHFSDAEPAYVAGTLAAYINGAKVPAAISINKDSKPVNIVVAGMSQYGIPFTKFGEELTATTDDKNILTINKVGNAISVTAIAPGTANLYIKCGSDVVQVQFTVDENTFAAKTSVLNAFQAAAGSYANVTMNYATATITADVVKDAKLVDAVSMLGLEKIFAARNLNITKINIGGQPYVVTDAAGIRAAIAAIAKKPITEVLLSDLNNVTIVITIDGVDYTLIG